jgi:tetratricopeptide (TPR) repeat protein
MIDIYQQLFQHQCKTQVRVYRGQYMTNDELQLFKDSVGEIISVNSFFSTSLVRETALEFINDNQPANNDLHKVLFKIDASPSVGTTKPFAKISQFSEYGDEAEILFSMNTVFRINSVHNGQNGIQVIRMTLCNDDEPCLKPLVDHINHRYKNKKSNLLLFCDILCEMKKFKEAFIYNGRFLQMPEGTTLLDTAKCYDNFGYLRSFANYDYNSSLTWYNKSLEIKQKFYKPNNIIFGLHYFSVGRVYEKNDDYKQASELYNKSLKIWKLIKGENHPDVITCYHKLGKMAEKIAHYSEALEYYKKVLTLRGKNLSTDDVRLGKLFFEIGNVHQHLNHYDEALDNYNLALKTYQNYITVNDLHVAFVLEKIAFVYEIQKLLIQSLIYYEKTAVIYGKILPQRHPNLNRIEMHIRNIRSKLKDDGIVDQNE